MKKTFSLVFLCLTAAVLSVFLMGCKPSTIDGAKFRGTKSVIEHERVAGKDTEDISDDLYSIVLKLSISIEISEKDKVMTIEESKFTLAPEYVSLELQDQYYQHKESVTARGPKSENNKSTSVTTMIHLKISFGAENSRETLEGLRAQISVAYDGETINFTTIYVPTI